MWQLSNKSEVLKLDIGAGPQREHYDDEEFTTVDAYADDVDVKANMWELPFEDDSVEMIWASHCLEHIPMAKVHPTLKEWHRVLKPGAKAIIRVPNFEYIARYFLTGPDRVWAEKMVFGEQKHEGDFHKCAFTHALLKGDCESAGFEVKRVELKSTHSQETLQAVCVKPLIPVKPEGTTLQ